MNPKIPCTYEGCPEEAKYYELPSKHLYFAINDLTNHCSRHYKDNRRAWNMDLRIGFATKSKKIYLAELAEILKASL